MGRVAIGTYRKRISTRDLLNHGLERPHGILCRSLLLSVLQPDLLQQLVHLQFEEVRFERFRCVYAILEARCGPLRGLRYGCRFHSRGRYALRVLRTFVLGLIFPFTSLFKVVEILQILCAIHRHIALVCAVICCACAGIRCRVAFFVEASKAPFARGLGVAVLQLSSLGYVWRHWCDCVGRCWVTRLKFSRTFLR
jgi:hypothetical protein